MDSLRAARIVSALSIAFGLFTLALPSAVADLFDLTVVAGQGSGWGEIGALYGGLFIAMGGIGLVAARAGFEEGPLLLLCLGVIWLGFAGGRLVVSTITAPEASGAIGWFNLVLEISVGGVLLWSGWKPAES
ncbi:MAG: hypothetical protein ACE5E4_05355 [Candidatus Binatia bacterium]